MSLSRVRGFLFLGMLLTGCAEGGTVMRLSNGEVTPGRFIGVQAYASFLRGALAEADGHEQEALAAYEATAAADPGDPEVTARILRLEHHEAEPADGAEVPKLVADGSSPEVLRLRLEALTLTYAYRAAAWDALAAWGTAHGDAALAVRGMIGVARVAPERRAGLAGAAATLAGEGFLLEARTLAAALLDAEPQGMKGTIVSLPIVERLAVDEALVRRDGPRALTRATRAHLSTVLLAGRAWAMGEAKLAAELIRPTVKADPSNLAARLVYEGANGRAGTRLLSARERGGGALPPEVLLPFARDVSFSEGAAAAGRVLAWGGPLGLSGGDRVLTPIVVELAVAGVVADDALPQDARVELAARRRTPYVPGDTASLDARHRLLDLALREPTASSTAKLAATLTPAASEDAVIAVALAKIAAAHGEPCPRPVLARLEASATVDPLAAATLLDVVGRTGTARSRAKEQLAALARTPAERALAAE